VVYLAAFGQGVGPVPWAMNAEIYPMGVRGAAAGVATSTNWYVVRLAAEAKAEAHVPRARSRRRVGKGAGLWLGPPCLVVGEGFPLACNARRRRARYVVRAAVSSRC